MTSPGSLLYRCRWIILGLAGLAALAAGLLLATTGLRKDYSIESFVARNDETYLRFRHFLELFVSNEMAIFAVTADDVLAPEPIAAIQSLEADARRIPHVQQATSIATIPYVDTSKGLLRSVVGAIKGPPPVGRLLVTQPERRDEICRWLLQNPLVAGNLLSPDAKTAAILVQAAAEGQGGQRRKAIVDALRTLQKQYQTKYPNLKIICAGPLVTLIDVFDALHRDLVVFSVVMAVMMVAMLAYVFRRPRPVISAVFVALATTLITLALSIGLNISMSLLTQVLVILVTINAVASCVHLAVAKEEIEHDNPSLSNFQSTRLTLQRMAGPCAVVSLTTAAGFASLRVSDLKPFQDISTLMVFAMLLALALALTTATLPSGKNHTPRRAAARQHQRLANQLEKLAIQCRRHPIPAVSLFVVGTALLAVKIPALRFESDFVKNFRHDSEVRRSYRYIAQRLTPVGSMELVIQKKTGEPVLSPDLLRKTQKLCTAVVDHYPVIKKAMSIDQIFTAAGLDIPASPDVLQNQMALIRKFAGDTLVRSFITDDGKTMRINLRAIEATSVYEKLDTAQGTLELARNLLGDPYHLEVTGLYPFYARLIAGLLRDQYRSFAVAFAAVFVVMCIGFRSVKITALAMIPNLLPMILCLGVMGWVRIPVNMGTAMILSVALGIAVDNTIHYLWRYRRELNAAGNEQQAMILAHRSVGRACVFTTLVLVGGFWTLCLSEFLPTVFFGALVGVTMLGALGADLVLWPLILTGLRPIRTEQPKQS